MLYADAFVRIRILKPTSGVLDGVSLSHLIPGLVYEVSASLGTFLIAQEAAEEDASSTIAVISSRENPRKAIGSVGEATPPFAIIFTKVAP